MSGARKPWRIPGASSGPDPAGLEEALRLLHEAADRKPSDDDRPPPSLFPLTPAAKAALRYEREARKRRAG